MVVVAVEKLVYEKSMDSSSTSASRNTIALIQRACFISVSEIVPHRISRCVLVCVPFCSVVCFRTGLEMV